MFLTVIDFETADFGNGPDDPPVICEVGRAFVNYDPASGVATVSEPTSAFCNPGRPITPEASAIHHIVDADVATAKPFDVIAPRLASGGPAYLVAHGADFERKLFNVEGAPWIDTYKIALRIWPDAPSHKLQVLRYFLELKSEEFPIGQAHRAGPDALVCALLMQRILAVASFTLEDMVRFSDGPALLPRCPIGEHRGKPWAEVPTGFLEWMIKKDFDRDLLANARYWLKQRDAEAR